MKYLRISLKGNTRVALCAHDDKCKVHLSATRQAILKQTEPGTRGLAQRFFLTRNGYYASLVRVVPTPEDRS